MNQRKGNVITRLPVQPWPLREVMYEAGPDGTPRVTGLRLANGGKGEKVVTADAYVAALVGALGRPGGAGSLPRVVCTISPYVYRSANPSSPLRNARARASTDANVATLVGAGGGVGGQGPGRRDA